MNIIRILVDLYCIPQYWNFYMIFQPNDRVKSLTGNLGTVHSISQNGIFLQIKFDDFDSLVVLYLDGRQQSWHKKPFIRKIK
jgi:hypothetical protein